MFNLGSNFDPISESLDPQSQTLRALDPPSSETLSEIIVLKPFRPFSKIFFGEILNLTAEASTPYPKS